MKLKMIHDLVLIKQHKREEVTQGGIVLPSEKQMKDDCIGTVMGVGPEVRDLTAGDTAWFLPAGERLVIDGHDHWIVREEEVLAKETP